MIETLVALILPALAPVVADGAKALFAKLAGAQTYAPRNVGEALQLMTAEVEKLRVLADLDRPTGEISRWVADLRASFRYVAAALIIVGTLTAMFAPGVPSDYVETMLQLCGSVFAFMFGDRMYLHLKGGKK